MQQTATEIDPALDQLKYESDLAVPVLQFKKDSSPATFIAEYTVDNNDLVYHFYPPQGGMDAQLWKVTFAQVLESVAVELFGVGAPRLVAAYTEEMASWWLRARGFANVGDPDKRSQILFSKIDEIFSGEITKLRQGGR